MTDDRTLCEQAFDAEAERDEHDMNEYIRGLEAKLRGAELENKMLRSRVEVLHEENKKFKERITAADGYEGNPHWEERPFKEVLDALRFQGSMTKALLEQEDRHISLIRELEAEVKRLKGGPGWCSEHGRQEIRSTVDYCEWCRKFAPWPQDLIDKALEVARDEDDYNVHGLREKIRNIRTILTGTKSATAQELMDGTRKLSFEEKDKAVGYIPVAVDKTYEDE